MGKILIKRKNLICQDILEALTFIALAFVALAFIALAFVNDANAASIQKCQDADGKWHYGNHAATECAQDAEITNMSEDGAEVSTIAAPPTAEELAAKQKARKEVEAAAKSAKVQREKDQNYVQIYGSEEVILSTRDRKLASIDNNLEVTRQLRDGVLKDISTLKARKQTEKVKKQILAREQAIASYDAVISNTLSERQKLEDSYVEILQEFRKASKRLGN